MTEQLLQDWMKHMESVLLENQGHRLTPVMINGLLFSMASSVPRVGAVPAPPERLLPPLQGSHSTDSGVTFQAMSLNLALVCGLRDVHQAHWEETEEYRNHVPLQVDYGRMSRYEDEGRFQLFVMLFGGRVVGNFMCYFDRSTHTGELIATEDALYVMPEYRNGPAMLFIRWIHEQLEAAGIKELRVETKLVNRAGDLLNRRFGYKHVANRYSKRLDKPEAVDEEAGKLRIGGIEP